MAAHTECHCPSYFRMYKFTGDPQLVRVEQSKLIRQTQYTYGTIDFKDSWYLIVYGPKATGGHTNLNREHIEKCFAQRMDVIDKESTDTLWITFLPPSGKINVYK